MDKNMTINEAKLVTEYTSDILEFVENRFSKLMNDVCELYHKENPDVFEEIREQLDEVLLK